MNSLVTRLFWIYLVALLLLTFLPLDGLDRNVPVDVRLHLFRTIRFDIRKGVGSPAFAEMVGNVVLFMPLGVFVPLLAKRRSILLTLVVAFALSASIEIGQFAISEAVGFGYRSADVDDVVTNVLGAAIGYIGFVLVLWLRGRGVDQEKSVGAP